MTAPDAFAAPQKALAERGPSIHDGGESRAIPPLPSYRQHVKLHAGPPLEEMP